MPNHFHYEREIFGTWIAIKLFLKRRLSVVGYIILTAAVIYSFALEREHSDQNRHELSAQTRITLIRGCDRQNDLRRTLQKVVLQSIPQIRQYVKDGTLTQVQANRAISNARSTAKAIMPTDCLTIYPPAKR